MQPTLDERMAKKPPTTTAPRVLESAAEVLDFFGGNMAIASQIAGLKAPTVRMWRYRNELPRAYYPHFQISLAAYGCVAAPQVFGLKSWRTIRLKRIAAKPRSIAPKK
jgi:hypothetical protein